MLIKYYFRIPTMLLLIVACSQRPPESGSYSVSDTANCYAAKTDNARVSALKTTAFVAHVFTDTLQFTGKTEPDPKHQRLVSVPMKGFLKTICVEPGQRVEHGQLLAVLEYPDYARLQLEYLETKAQYDYDKQDYARQGELGLEEATSLKNVQKAQRDFLSIESKYYSLKKQLEYIGIIPDSIHINNIAPNIRITAPANGDIAFENISSGKLYDEKEPLFRIIDRSVLLISFSVPQSDLFKIGPRSYISFIHPEKPSIVRLAKITSPVPTEENNGKFTFYASYVNSDLKVYPGMQFEVSLPYNNTAYAVPEKSVVNASDKNFIFSEVRPDCFKLTEIKIGRSQNGWIEIPDVPSRLLNHKIICSGIETLTATRKQEE
jgi:cobalt-zinc-cadmium efflux system membrane fusion protein